MPEIFDQNDDWVGALLSKEPNKSHAAPSIGLLMQYSKGALVHYYFSIIAVQEIWIIGT